MGEMKQLEFSIQDYLAEMAKIQKLKIFTVHNTDAENKFLQTKLFEKWDTNVRN